MPRALVTSTFHMAHRLTSLASSASVGNLNGELPVVNVLRIGSDFQEVRCHIAKDRVAEGVETRVGEWLKVVGMTRLGNRLAAGALSTQLMAPIRAVFFDIGGVVVS